MKSACSRIEVVGLFVAALLLVGCDRQPAATTGPATVGTQPAGPSQLTQVSIINALMVGQYNGVLPIGELLRAGNFGLGTCDHLDGELIVLDGVAYQVRSDATVREVPQQETTPFAVVVPFRADGHFACPAANSLTQLEGLLDKQLPGRNAFVAVRIEAKLKSIYLRSVPRQEPPYQPLAEVAKRQATWQRQDVEGTLIGIRSPPWVSGINVPGYHWHFLSHDHRLGGHIIDCQVEAGDVSFDQCDTWTIRLSDTPEFNRANLNQNLSKELDHVERSRGIK